MNSNLCSFFNRSELIPCCVALAFSQWTKMLDGSCECCYLVTRPNFNSINDLARYGRCKHGGRNWESSCSAEFHSNAFLWMNQHYCFRNLRFSGRRCCQASNQLPGDWPLTTTVLFFASHKTFFKVRSCQIPYLLLACNSIVPSFTHPKSLHDWPHPNRYLHRKVGSLF